MLLVILIIDENRKSDNEQKSGKIAENGQNSNYHSNEYDKIGTSVNFDLIHKDSLKSAIIERPDFNTCNKFNTLYAKAILSELEEDERRWVLSFVKGYDEQGIWLRISTIFFPFDVGF